MTTDTQDFIAQLRNTDWARPLPCTACHKIADALEALQAEVERRGVVLLLAGLYPDCTKEDAKQRFADYESLQNERDAALARLAELEKQEPVGWHTTANRIVGLFHYDGTPIDGYEAGWKLVYAAAGASPQPAPDHIEHDLEMVSAQPSQAGEPCEWTLDDDESGTWASSCGELWSFIDGGPAENLVTYCHHCGKRAAINAKETP